MRILVVTGTRQAAEHEARRNMNQGSGAVLHLHPHAAIRKDDSEVLYWPMYSQEDAERLRGQRFDLIIEDGSFNPDRVHVKGGWLDLARIITLR